MNYRMVLKTVGKVLILEAGFLLLPLLVGVIYGESCVKAFAITAVIALIAGVLLDKLCKPKTDNIFAKDGFAIVAWAWIILSAIGALPFVISGEIPNYIDALFETVSGFTTTGASLVTSVESLSHGVLFWRSFTHWIGGMGILVFIMMITSQAPDRSINILRAEMPGPIVDKILPKARDTSSMLYKIYLVLTILEMLFLLAGGMPLFDSIVHALGTAGTGGFGIKADSIGGYSPYLQWVITIFMLLFGVNFNIYYLILLKRVKSALESTELRVYIIMVVIASAVIAINIFPIYNSVADSVRHSAFQIAALITTTGFSTVDFNLWPSLSKGILFFFMFLGGCAGSTAGGLKLSRFMILWQMVRREIRRAVYPREVTIVRVDGKPVNEETQRGVASYFAFYCICIMGTFLLLSFEPFDFETNFTAAVSCFNNVGPGLGMVGPAGGYADYSAFSKIVLSISMLLGRLEIYPLVLAFASFSRRRT